VPGGASLGRLSDGGDADDAGAVASADDCASSTSHPVATQWCRHAGHFMTASRAQCACVRLHSVGHCDVVNPTLQIRCIGRRSAVALSSPMRPFTADAPVSDVRHQHRSDTIDNYANSYAHSSSINKI